MVRHKSLPELLVLALICAGFAGSLLVYRIVLPDHFDFLTSDEVMLGFFSSAGTFWLGVKIAGSDDANNPRRGPFNEFCMGTGLVLIVQALLNYIGLLTRSFFLIAVGGALAASLLAIARWLLPSRGAKIQAGTVMVGFDRASAELAGILPYPLVGVVGGPSDVPGTPVVGYGQLEESLKLWDPRQIVVSAHGMARIDPSVLLNLRLDGTSIKSTPELFEALLGRVSCAGREPVDVLLSQVQSGNTQAMAFQAVYTNLIGLGLLIAAAPLIAVAMGAIALFSGPGPIIETEECSGFQNIPFRRMRFRTRRTDGTRVQTRVGSVISRLRLGSLPLLFNIVRGEMALFGPRPVRREFVGPLTKTLPFYSMRSAVKPGIISWAAVQSHRYRVRIDALTEIEYDLYYVKHASPLLDFEILMRLIVGGKRGKDSPLELAPVVR